MFVAITRSKIAMMLIIAFITGVVLCASLAGLIWLVVEMNGVL